MAQSGEHEDGVRRPSGLLRQQVEAMRVRDIRARRTMATLHDALLQLVEEQAFEQITVDDIVRRAGVARSTFYRHYITKDALIDEIARAEIDSIMALSVPALTQESSVEGCRAVALYVQDRRKLWGALLTGGAAATMRQRFFERASRKRADRSDETRTDLPIELSAVLGVTATVEILAWWLRQEVPDSVDVIAHYIDRLAVRPTLDFAAPSVPRPES